MIYTNMPSEAKNILIQASSFVKKGDIGRTKEQVKSELKKDLLDEIDKQFNDIVAFTEDNIEPHGTSVVYTFTAKKINE